MSDVETLTKQLEQQSAGVENLLAQLDAYKGSYNEAIQIGLNLRINLVMFQKENKKLHDKNVVLQKSVDELGSKLNDALNKIQALESPLVAADAA